MKICHLTSVHSSLDDRIFEKECCSLASKGYETYIVAKGDSFEKDKVKIIGIGKLPHSRIKRMLFTSYKIYKVGLKLDAEIYHLHDPELLLFAMKLKKRGKYVIFDVHEDVPRQILAKDWIPYLLRKWVSDIYEKYEKNVAKKIDYVITATPHIESVFAQYIKDVQSICNYPTKDSLNISIRRRSFSEPSQQLCYAGGLTKARGLEMMLLAANKSGCKLKLAGSLKDKYKSLLNANANEKIKYVGYLPREKVKELYEESHIGIIVLEPTPNHINAYAIKLFEYMAAGLPVICSNFPLWEKIVKENGCGVCVDPLDENELVFAIEYLRCHPETEKKMGLNGRKLIENEYNWDREAEKLLSIYEKIQTRAKMS